MADGAMGHERGASRRAGWRERAGTALVCVLVLAFYGWTVRSTGESLEIGPERHDYYNLLIDGWLDGQLHMKVEVSDALSRLADPYDPAQRPAGVGLHDASFYRGKYYLYFGAGLVATLMLPFRVLTGVDLPLALAVLVFAGAGFLASVAVLREIRRQLFPGTSALVLWAGVAVLGWAAPVAVLLRRPDIWELPIAAGYCWAMLSLWAVARAMRMENAAGRACGLAGAALALGFAIASRPTYIFALPLLLVPLAVGWRRARVLPRLDLVGVALPLALVGAAVAWHNYARFGDPLQFGQKYQLSLDYESKLPHFAARYVPYNAGQHLFGRAQWSRYFPFIAAPTMAQTMVPTDYTVHRGDVYGVLANQPIAWLVLALPLAWRRRTAGERAALAGGVGAIAVAALGMAAVLHAFFSALMRYQVDFVPALLLLAAIGMLALERWLDDDDDGVRPAVRGAVRSGLVGAAAWSGAFGVLVTLQFDGLLRERNPELTRELARQLNAIPAAWERVAGVEYGAMELTVRLPGGVAGTEETLLTVGEGATAERVCVRHEADGAVRLGFRDGRSPERWSEALAVDRSAAHRIRISLGSLYPPREHAFFRGRSDDEALALRRRLEVALDDAVVLEGYRRFGSGGAVRSGRAAGFTGAVEVTRRIVAPVRPLAPVSAGDTLRLRVRLPAGRTGAREPLVVTGATGAGDLLIVDYVSAAAIRMVLDHWGAPEVASAPVAVDFSREQEIEVTLGSLVAVRDVEREGSERMGTLRVRVNDATVLEREAGFYTAEPDEVAVGRNPIGGTSCGERFTGEILASERVTR